MDNKNTNENAACLYSSTDMLRSTNSFIAWKKKGFTFHDFPNTDKCIVAAVVIDNENTLWLHKKDAQCNSLNLLAQPEAWELSR